MAKPETTPPANVPVTAAWQQEMQRRQAAYAAQRARWVGAWLRGGEPEREPEPPTETERPGHRRSRTVFDKRQFRFDF